MEEIFGVTPLEIKKYDGSNFPPLVNEILRKFKTHNSTETNSHSRVSGKIKKYINKQYKRIKPLNCRNISVETVKINPDSFCKNKFIKKARGYFIDYK